MIAWRWDCGERLEYKGQEETFWCEGTILLLLKFDYGGGYMIMYDYQSSHCTHKIGEFCYLNNIFKEKKIKA